LTLGSLAPPKRSGEFREALISRLKVAGVLCALAYSAVVVGYWYHQVVRADHYRQLAENNRLREREIQAPRGVVEDRRGRLLVENVPSYSLLVDRNLLQDRSSSLAFASRVLARPKVELEVRLETAGGSRFEPAVLFEDLDLAQVATFEAAAWEHPEFSVEVAQRRLYRHGSQTAHVLGYLGQVTQADLARAAGALRSGDLVGRNGLEEEYDSRLRGRDGSQVLVVDSRGRRIEQVRRTSAVPGQRLRLTLDLDLQQVAAEELGERAGVVVAMDPRTGAVRALLSSPSFDPNQFATGLDSQEWQQLVDAPHDPLQNRAIYNAYSPGSVFKIVVAMAALQEGVVSPETSVWCGGQKRYWERPRRCWKQAGHGRVNLFEAIKFSCDIYFYEAGQQLGVDSIAAWAERFGLGRATGIDLSGERSGLVPSSEWSQRSRRSPWYPGETISVSIGQGPLLVTPLQVAVMMAAVANGGFLVTPHLVDGDIAPRQPIDLDPDHLKLLQRALNAVVNERGSGQSAAVRGYQIAGKTGTAQVIEQRTWTDSEALPYEYRDHAWFASYGPVEAPELVVVVFVEHGGLGSRSAAPLAKKIYERAFRVARTPRS
jgi:penicillin-binding protein 2